MIFPLVGQSLPGSCGALICKNGFLLESDRGFAVNSGIVMYGVAYGAF
jgi:hypothetical protein